MTSEASAAPADAGALYVGLAALVESLSALMWPLIVLTLVLLLVRQPSGRELLAATVDLLSRITSISFPAGGMTFESGNKSSTVTRLMRDQNQMATAEGLTALKPEHGALDAMAAASTVGRYPYLLHETRVVQRRTVPGSGRYAVRVWLEFDVAYGFGSDKVARVTYGFGDDFAPGGRIVETSTAENGFEMLVLLWGELTVIAEVETVDGERIALTRYLDLPDRAGGD